VPTSQKTYCFFYYENPVVNVFLENIRVYWQYHMQKAKMSGGTHMSVFLFLLALQPPLGVVFYSPLVGFSLLAYEVS